jgi:hypothetical protein
MNNWMCYSTCIVIRCELKTDKFEVFNDRSLHIVFICLTYLVDIMREMTSTWPGVYPGYECINTKTLIESLALLTTVDIVDSAREDLEVANIPGMLQERCRAPVRALTTNVIV